VKAFLLAARPAQIRLIGQAPLVGTTVFDMASDGETFRVFHSFKAQIPGRYGGRGEKQQQANRKSPPQHLLDALLWPEIRKERIDNST